MRVGVITNRNLRSPWASAHFYIHRALLSLGIDAVQVAGKEISEYYARQGSRKIGVRKKSPLAGVQADPFPAELAQAVRRDVDRCGYDILLALHASTVVPTLRISCPLIYTTDATAALLNNYYPKRQKLPEQEIQWLQECEETTISRADAILVPTQWAADSVLLDYGAHSSRVHVIEWGGNFGRMPDLTEGTGFKDDAVVRFLFVGLDWERKGGDVAVKTIESLRESGIDAHLTVVGAPIPKRHRSSFVRSVGKLNRANEEQSELLDQLFRSADFYIHPASAECYGHVLCEALGFGVPVLATRTGGISQCVLDGETGLLFPPEASAADYAQQVRELLANETLLTEMRTNAVLDFRRRLSWDCWAPRVHQIMHELLSPTVSASPE